MQASVSVGFCTLINSEGDKSKKRTDKSRTDEICSPVKGCLSLAHVWDACASACRASCPTVIASRRSLWWKLLEMQCAAGRVHKC